jgi:SAM-dependent methyltransferase
MMSEMRCCPACGGKGNLRYGSNIDEKKITEHSYSSRKIPEFLHHAYMECVVCGTLFVGETPSSEVLEKSYNEAAFVSKADSKYAADTYFQNLKKLGLLNEGSLIDIGCSDGAFICKVKRDSKLLVTGIEPSLDAIKNADVMVQAEIHHTSLGGFNSPHKYDLVTCFQTIEQINDVDTLFAKSKDLLADGGSLVIVCHDRHSLVNRVLGPKSPIFDIEHLQIFNRISIRILMQRYQFSEIRVMPIANRYPISYWMLLAPFPGVVKRFLNKYRDSRVLKWGLTVGVGNLLVIGRK